MRDIERAVRCGSVVLRAMDWRPQERERDVLLLHGLASVAEWWNLVVPHLIGGGLGPVALDQRGHGRSDRPAAGYSYGLLITDALATIEQLELRDPIVVGHSWGGATAVALAAYRPQDIAGAVSIDGALVPFKDRVSWEQAAEFLAPPQWREPLDELVARVRAGDLGEYWNDEVEAIVRCLFERKEGEAWGSRFPFDAHMQVVRAMYDADVSNWFGILERQVRLLFARGHGDPAWIAIKEEFVATLDSELVHVDWLEDSIHDVPLQRPELVARHIIEFANSLA